MTSNINGRTPETDANMLKMFAQNRKINKSCFKHYPTKYDIDLAYANNSLAVANSLFLGGCYEGQHERADLMSYGNKLVEKIKEYSKLRNKELDKFQKISGISRICDCRWEHPADWNSK